MNAVEYSAAGQPPTDDCNVISIEGRLERKGTAKLDHAPMIGLNKQSGLKCTGRGHPPRVGLPKGLR